MKTYRDRSRSDQIPKSLEVLLRTAHETLSYRDRDRIIPLIDAVVNEARRRRSILALVQDTLSQLRLDMKYLMFDLEATRRERDEYKEKLNL